MLSVALHAKNVHRLWKRSWKLEEGYLWDRIIKHNNCLGYEGGWWYWLLLSCSKAKSWGWDSFICFDYLISLPCLFPEKSLKLHGIINPISTQLTAFLKCGSDDNTSCIKSIKKKIPISQPSTGFHNLAPLPLQAPNLPQLFTPMPHGLTLHPSPFFSVRPGGWSTGTLCYPVLQLTVGFGYWETPVGDQKLGGEGVWVFIPWLSLAWLLWFVCVFLPKGVISFGQGCPYSYPFLFLVSSPLPCLFRPPVVAAGLGCY